MEMLIIALVLIGGALKVLILFLKMLPSILKKYFKRKQAEQKKPIYAEDIVYNTDKVYILYSIVQNNFNYCMKNRLLKRKDILEFKIMLNKFVYQNDYKHEKFKNDAHEIYTKLKSKTISKSHMFELNEFLQPFIALEVQQPIEQPIQKYGNLVVVK